MTASTDSKPLNDFQIGSIKAYRRECHAALGAPVVEDAANKMLGLMDELCQQHNLTAAQVAAVTSVVAVSLGHSIQIDPNCPLDREAFRVAFLSTIDSIMSNLQIIPVQGSGTVQ